MENMECESRGKTEIKLLSQLKLSTFSLFLDPLAKQFQWNSIFIQFIFQKSRNLRPAKPVYSLLLCFLHSFFYTVKFDFKHHTISSSRRAYKLFRNHFSKCCFSLQTSSFAVTLLLVRDEILVKIVWIAKILKYIKFERQMRVVHTSKQNAYPLVFGQQKRKTYERKLFLLDLLFVAHISPLIDCPSRPAKDIAFVVVVLNFSPLKWPRSQFINWFFSYSVHSTSVWMLAFGDA